MDDMENVAGGTYYEARDDVKELWKRGFFNAVRTADEKQVQTILHRLGYTKCQIHCHRPADLSEGPADAHIKNVYADKDGNIVSREQFWKEFDEEFI